MTDWKQTYKDAGALFIHDGNPARPHCLLTSGKHSGGFFNSRLVTNDEALLRRACIDMLDLLPAEVVNLFRDSRNMFIGPATGANPIVEMLAELLSCRYGWTIKGTNNQMRWTGNFDLSAEDLFLPTEDVITTGGSVVKLMNAVTRKVDAAAIGYVLCLVNRSGKQDIGGRKILALVNEDMPIWTQDKCLHCTDGSEAIRPKDNWNRLNAVY